MEFLIYSFATWKLFNDMAKYIHDVVKYYLTSHGIFLPHLLCAPRSTPTTITITIFITHNIKIP
jgi:hypothetical protein